MPRRQPLNTSKRATLFNSQQLVRTGIHNAATFIRSFIYRYFPGTELRDATPGSAHAGVAYSGTVATKRRALAFDSIAVESGDKLHVLPKHFVSHTSLLSLIAMKPQVAQLPFYAKQIASPILQQRNQRNQLSRNSAAAATAAPNTLRRFLKNRLYMHFL